MITGLAIIIRIIPAWINAAWGCDFGIYFGITKSMAQSGTLFPAYTGWGGSYNEFPVLYAINTVAHWITGIEIIDLMPKLTPIFGGLSVLIFYFVVRELTTNKKIALLSALFFAFMPFHVYQTSHASPLTLGHFFIMLSLYLFIKYRQEYRYIIPLLISTALLTMSHHLSTYFYLITLIGIVFVENASLKNWTVTLKKDIFYITAASLLIFSYWAFIAKTVYERFMASLTIGGIRIEPIYIVIAFYVVFACSFLVVKLIRKLNHKIIRFKSSAKSPVNKNLTRIIWYIYPFIKKKWPTTKSRHKRFLAVTIFITALMLFFTTINIPWLGFSFTIEAVIFSIPLIITIAFGVAGLRYTWYIKNGVFVRGWLLALTASFIVMMAVNNKGILPHRHLEYFMAPLAIATVFGIGGIFSDPFFKGLFSKLSSKKDVFIEYTSGKIRILKKNRVISFLIVLLLVSSLAGTTYEVHKVLDQSLEGITSEDLNTIEWMGLNLDKNTSLITSDHQIERLAEAEGFNTTKDLIVNLWSAENLSEYVDELIGVGVYYNKVTHIVINNKMKNDLVHIGQDPQTGDFRTIYMTNETWNTSYEKFKKQPFELIYTNQTEEIDEERMEPVRWCEVYRVNWTYIESVI